MIVAQDKTLAALGHHGAKRSGHHKVVLGGREFEADRRPWPNGPALQLVVRGGAQQAKLARDDHIGRNAVHRRRE